MIILLFEYEKELLLLFKTILEVEDHGILLAYNEIESIKKINNFLEDLIVLDTISA